MKWICVRHVGNFNVISNLHLLASTIIAIQEDEILEYNHGEQHSRVAATIICMIHGTTNYFQVDHTVDEVKAMLDKN